MLCLGLLEQAKAGGWLQGEGNGYFKLSQSAIHGDEFYNGVGDVVDITTTGVYITALYGEYGISNKFDLIGYIPLATRLTLNEVKFSSGATQEGDEFTSIGDIDFGLKYGLIQDKKMVLSASLILGIPSGNTSGGNTELLQTGDGEFNQMLRLEAGYGFSFPLYTNLGVAFNNRTKGFSEEFRYDFEIGYQYKKKLLLAFKLASVNSLNNGDPEGSAGNGIFSNNLEYVTFGPEVAYIAKDKWGISAAYRTASSGQFIIAAPAYEVGVFMKIKE